jgi:predicted hydrolase (HD superfamily)
MKAQCPAVHARNRELLTCKLPLGVDLDEHIGFCVKAMQERADTLGLKGSI